MNTLPVTAVICTKDRYSTTLPLAIAAVLNQHPVQPAELLVMDDSANKVDMRGPETPHINALFNLATNKGVQWRVVFGYSHGQVALHQVSQKIANHELIWRVDDDNIPEPRVLTYLYAMIKDKPDVGAVGSLVTVPNFMRPPSALCSGMIRDSASRLCPQMFELPSDVETDHLHNTFLYRKGIANYPDYLSVVGHREETLFTYAIKRTGKRLIINSKCRTWHLRTPYGGIRSYSDGSLWAHDEEKFRQQMKEWGVNLSTLKVCILACGLGDHYIFKQVLPEIIAKHGRVIVGATYPEVFKGMEDSIDVISVAEALLVGDGSKCDVYKFMAENNWTGTIHDAFRAIYLN